MATGNRIRSETDLKKSIEVCRKVEKSRAKCGLAGTTRHWQAASPAIPTCNGPISVNSLESLQLPSFVTTDPLLTSTVLHYSSTDPQICNHASVFVSVHCAQIYFKKLCQKLFDLSMVPLSLLMLLIKLMLLMLMK